MESKPVLKAFVRARKWGVPVSVPCYCLACSFEAAMKGDTSFIAYAGTCGCSRSL